MTKIVYENGLDIDSVCTCLYNAVEVEVYNDKIMV